MTVACRVAEEHGDRDLLHQSVRRLRSAPRPMDTEFLLGIVSEETEPETLRLAAQSLERLGIDNPRWCSDCSLSLIIRTRTCVSMDGGAGQAR